MKMNYEQIIGLNISSRAAFAYSRYWLHKYQSVFQFGRVQSGLHERSLSGEWLKEPELGQPDAIRLWFHFGGFINKKVLAEVHLLFISIDNVKDMMNTILSEDNLVYLKKKLGRFIHSLDHYTHGRNTFEHYDDRIPGGRKHSKVGETKSSPDAGPRRILGGLKGSIYTFGNKEWDLSPQEFQKIINGMNEFEIAIHGHLDKIPEKSYPSN